MNTGGNRRSYPGPPRISNPFLVMSLRLPIALLLGIFAGLAGCTTARTPAERIARDSAAFDAWPADVQQRVRAGEVAVGFTEPQVRMALGEPHVVATRTTTEGETTVWTYRDKSPRVGFSFGVGSGGGGSGVGLGVGTSTGGTQQPRLRVIFSGGVVTAVERAR